MFDLAALGLSSHPDVILPRNTDFYQQGKSTGNVFEGNTISGPPGSGGSNGNGSSNGGSSNIKRFCIPFDDWNDVHT